jgi:autotransporter passenger strand-loop-strand repeat protein
MTTVTSGKTLNVSTTVKHDVVRGGGTLNVDSGGIASATTVSSGGAMFVLSGGIARGTTLKIDALEEIFAGGVASGTVVSSRAGELVSSGGVASGTVILSGGEEDVQSAGSGVDAVVSSGGSAVVEAGGVATGTVVSSGGVIAITVSSALSPWNAAGSNDVDGVTILSGAVVQLTLAAGGSVSGFIAGSGASEAVGSGAVASGTVVSGGGEAFVLSDGVASGIVVGSGGSAIIGSGGTASGLVVESGGSAVIEDATVGGSVVSSGGGVFFALTGSIGSWSAGGSNVVDGVTIDAGAIVGLNIEAGGAVSGFVVSSGAIVEVYDGGVASGTVVSSGGQEFALSGSDASGTVVESGATLDVQLDTNASGTVVSSGGVIGLVVSSAQAWSASGTNVVDGVTLLSGAVVQLTLVSGGSVSGFVDSSGGDLFIASGASASGTVIDSGGEMILLSGGIASGTALSSGGVIELQGVSGKSVSWKDGVLSVKLANGAVETLSLPGNYAKAKFVLEPDFNGNTFVSLRGGSPVIAAPKSATVAEGQATPVAGISLSESGGNAAELFIVTLKDKHGDLSVSGVEVEVIGNGTTSLTFKGDLSEVNSALATLEDTDGATASDAIKVTARDFFGKTAPGKSIAVTVTAQAGVTVPVDAANLHGHGGVASTFLHHVGPVAGSRHVAPVKANDVPGMGLAAGGKLDLTHGLAGTSLAQDLIKVDLARVTRYGTTGAPEIPGPRGTALNHLGGGSKLEPDDLLTPPALPQQ